MRRIISMILVLVIVLQSGAFVFADSSYREALISVNGLSDDKKELIEEYLMNPTYLNIEEALCHE